MAWAHGQTDRTWILCNTWKVGGYFCLWVSVKGWQEVHLGIKKGKTKHILAAVSALMPGSQGPAMLLRATRPSASICASLLNGVSEAGALSGPRLAWAAGAWEAIFHAHRVQLDAMCCLSLYGTTEPHYRCSTQPNIHRKGKPDWPGHGLQKGRKAANVCRQWAAWAIKSLPRKILFEH